MPSPVGCALRTIRSWRRSSAGDGAQSAPYGRRIAQRGVSRIALLTMLAAVLLALACNGSRGEQRTRVVRFWGFGREGEVVREMVPEFERLHPGIRVEVQQIPWTAAHEKLLTAFVGRTTPDVTQLGNTWIAELAALDALLPLDTLLAGSPTIDREDFFGGVWDTNVVDGTTWGVPWYVDTRVLFYRPDLVAATGAPWPPKSWGELRQAMDGIAERGGGERFAILLPIDEWAQPVIFGLQSGAELLADNGTRGHFRDPRFRRALAFYADLYASRLAPPLDASGLANLYQQFAEGYFAMVITGPWNLGEFKRRLPADQQDRWATAPLPPPEPGMEYPGASIAGGSSLVLFRRAADPEAAWAWVEFLAAPAQQARFYELTGDLPARRSAWQRTGLAADPKAASFLQQLEHVVPLPKVPECERIVTLVAERAERVVRGGQDLDAALAALDADTDRILEKRRWLLSRAGLKGSLP
jgi:multiple sugar transport system substrate-binding protein